MQSKRADVVALATAGLDATPSVRMVYFKGIRAGGFSFFTNYESRKGKEILENPKASMTFYWPELRRQVRVDGACKKVSSEESENYFLSRDRESQLSAFASQQSHEMRTAETLENKIAAIRAALDGKTIPRPVAWGGFALVPKRIEFWIGGPHRRHSRKVYECISYGWDTKLLFP